MAPDFSAIEFNTRSDINHQPVATESLEMTSSILYFAIVALLASRRVSADYWVTCEYTAIKSCLIELNYNQYSSSTAGASALASATDTNVRTISYSGTPTVSSFEKLLLLDEEHILGEGPLENCQCMQRAKFIVGKINLGSL